MIHLICRANASLYADELRAMHQLRWRIYVEERGWRALRAMQAEEGLERDIYDDERAHYLVALDDEGAVLGAMRVRPTDDRSLIKEVFPHLVEDPSALRPDPRTWELTRLMRDPARRAQEGALRYEMNCALIEFCLSRGIERLIATSETFLLPMTRKAWGEKLRPLGLPHAYEEGEVIAVELLPDLQALKRMRSAGAVTTAQLYEHPVPCEGGGEHPLQISKAIAAMRCKAADALKTVEAA